MKIVVLDGYCENPGDLSWGELERLGALTVYERTSLTNEREIVERIAGADVVLTNKTPLSRAVLEACPSIRFIAVLATGYNVVDIACAAERGIPVSNVPAYGTASVSQFAIALLLEICSRVAMHDAAVHQGRWATSPDWCFWEAPLMELARKTMGIIGFGRIGQATGAIAKALGMEVIAHDTHEDEAGRQIAEYVDLQTLFARADVVVLHCPLVEQTRGIIRSETIAQMKNGAILINNSRGPLVVEQDLANALNAGKLYAAAVDVVSDEPIAADNPLLTAKNCIITPHISWAPHESRQRILDATVANVASFCIGSPINVVNL